MSQPRNERGQFCDAQKWELKSGEKLTAREIEGDSRNIHRINRKTIYTRLQNGDRTWRKLLRVADRSEAGRAGARASPWGMRTDDFVGTRR